MQCGCGTRCCNTDTGLPGGCLHERGRVTAKFIHLRTQMLSEGCHQHCHGLNTPQHATCRLLIDVCANGRGAPCADNHFHCASVHMFTCTGTRHCLHAGCILGELAAHLNLYAVSGPTSGTACIVRFVSGSFRMYTACGHWRVCVRMNMCPLARRICLPAYGVPHTCASASIYRLRITC